MAFYRCPWPKFVWYDLNGYPLSGGTLYGFIAGTDDPLPLYAGSSGVSYGPSVTLDDDGSKDVYLDSGYSYKLILKDAAGNTVWSEDDVMGGSGGLSGLTWANLASPGDLLHSLGSVDSRYDYVWSANASMAARDGDWEKSVLELYAYENEHPWLRAANTPTIYFHDGDSGTQVGFFYNNIGGAELQNIASIKLSAPQIFLHENGSDYSASSPTGLTQDETLATREWSADQFIPLAGTVYPNYVTGDIYSDHGFYAGLPWGAKPWMQLTDNGIHVNFDVGDITLLGDNSPGTTRFLHIGAPTGEDFICTPCNTRNAADDGTATMLSIEDGDALLVLDAPTSGIAKIESTRAHGNEFLLPPDSATETTRTLATIEDAPIDYLGSVSNDGASSYSEAFVIQTNKYRLIRLVSKYHSIGGGPSDYGTLSIFINGDNAANYLADGYGVTTSTPFGTTGSTTGSPIFGRVLLNVPGDDFSGDGEIDVSPSIGHKRRMRFSGSYEQVSGSRRSATWNFFWGNTSDDVSYLRVYAPQYLAFTLHFWGVK